MTADPVEQLVGIHRLSEEHERQICRFLREPYDAEAFARGHGFRVHGNFKVFLRKLSEKDRNELWSRLLRARQGEALTPSEIEEWRRRASIQPARKCWSWQPLR